MSGLKVHRFITTDELFPEANAGVLYYEKSEADKVIAELEESHKKEVGQLLILNREQANAANKLRDSMEQAIRHYKYKRCLAMAISCEADAKLNQEFAADASEYMPSYEARFQRLAAYYEKWRKRWIAIADKFKEAK